MPPSAFPPVSVVNSGITLHRVHQASRGAEFYGNRDATWRYDSPSGAFGVLYLGFERSGPFAETLLRDLHDRDILWSNVQKRAEAQFATTRTLRLAKVHGEGLGWFGVTADQVRAPHDPKAALFGYEITQRLSQRVHDDFRDIDGIEYRSRYNDELCVALFERASTSVRLQYEGIPFDRVWVEATLHRSGFALIDLGL